MKKILLIIIIILVTIQLGGCGKQEVDKLETATAIAIDITDDGSFQLTAQVLNPNAMGENSKDVAPVIVVTEKGRTIQEVIRKVTNYFQNKLYFAHFQILLIGENLAIKGIEPYLNFFSINTESLHSYNVVVVKGMAEDVLKELSLLSIVPSIALENKIEAALDQYGISRNSFMDEVINDIRTEGMDLALPSFIIEGDPKEGEKGDSVKEPNPKTKIKVSDIGIFKKDKLVGWLSETESLGYNYIIGHIKSSAVVATMSDGDLVSVEVSGIKRKYEFELRNNVPVIKVNVEVEANVTEDLSGQTEATTEYANEVGKRVSYEIKKMMEDSLKKAKQFKSDVFHFGKKIHNDNPKYWKSIKDNYDTVFANLTVEINVKTTITRVAP